MDLKNARLLPRGATTLEAEDQLVLIAHPERLEELKEYLDFP